MARAEALAVDLYDPFVRGPYRVQTKNVIAEDQQRGSSFDCTTWNPADCRPSALILVSHFSGGSRTAYRYVCEHLSSHGYSVAALDHSDNTLPRPSEAADPQERKARMDALIAARVPDIQWLLEVAGAGAERVGIIGHSFGGWTALAVPSMERRIDAVVALAPAGASRPRPGIIAAPLDFAWGRDVPTLVIAGDCDVSIPLEQVRNVFDRIPATKRLVILRGVDHLHFVANAAEQHERVRNMAFPPELAWIQREMRPFAELRPEEEVHRIVAGLSTAHFDVSLRANRGARQFLESYASG